MPTVTERLNHHFTTPSFPSIAVSSTRVIATNTLASVKSFRTSFLRRASSNSNRKSDFMLPNSLGSGIASLTRPSKVFQATRVKDGKGRMAVFGWILFPVSTSNAQSHFRLNSPPLVPPFRKRLGRSTSLFTLFKSLSLLVLTFYPGANYLSFDIVGDLAFGAPFGMIESAKDLALVPKNPADVMRSYGKETQTEVVEIPAVKILNGRGEYSMSMGVLPARWRPFVAHLPWYRAGSKDVKTLAGIAIMAVAKRLATETDRVDLLSKLQQARDSEGKPMSREELTAEALTLLIAGSDTTSK